jgi:hypothetical protein
MLDAAPHLESVTLVERHVARVGRFEIGQRAFAIADCQRMAEQCAAQTSALMPRVDADQRQIPVRLARMKIGHLLHHLHAIGHGWD